MCLPYLTSCCGLLSVKTGTFFIALFNQFLSLIGFVSYISSVVIVLRNRVSPEMRFFILITLSFGILVTAAHVVLAFILLRGLQKEKPVYLRWYLITAPGIIILSSLFVGGMAVLVHWLTSITSTAVIAANVYFLLVIRSAYKEMQTEERILTAARSNV